MARPKVTWPLIRERRNKQKIVTSYMVDCGMMDSKRVRFFYKTRDEAETKAALMRVTRENEGEDAFTMRSRDRIDAEGSLALLRPHGVTLRQAAEFYLSNVDVIQAAKTYSAVVAELLHAKDQDGKSDRYLQDMRNRLEVASDVFGDRLIHEIKGAELDDYLRALPVGGVSRNNIRRLFSVLFSFAVRRRYALINPVAQIDIVNVERGKPNILTLAEAHALMIACDREIISAVAIALFAGLRPEAEIIARDHPLDWRHVDLDEMSIDVDKSKNVGSHRYVAIKKNLAQWLKPYARKSGVICSADYYSRLRKAREIAVETLEAAGKEAENLIAWPGDVLRHSYASYHCGAFKDSRLTSQEMGHSGNLQIFNRHYRNRVKEADALAFWQISPV
jgi:site-specific recombinase XerC